LVLSWRFTRPPSPFAVGIVRETIQAERDITRARLDDLRAIAAPNQARYALRKGTGSL
jgi:hypothetical protein